MESKIVLVRSSRELIEKGYVGYGWSSVEFRKYTTAKELIEDGFKSNNIPIGRKRKQIILFHSIKKGDIVVVPVGGAIAIGIGTDNRDYEKEPTIPHSNNRIKVNFFKNKKGEVLYVPRTELVTNLERRLKIRMSIASLEDFRIEIENIKSDLEQGKIYTWDSEIMKKEEQAKKDFIESLEKRLRTEKGLGISAGGYGLEKLIREIFQAKGYDAHIPAKNNRPAGEDVDIIATKESEFGLTGEVYLVQSKHHRGSTNMHGLNQLINYDTKDYDKDTKIYKVLITTALKVVDGLEDKAKDECITVVKGEQLAKWVYDNLSFLSQKTLRKLGISEVPTLI
jgi:restriction system protein